MVRVLGSQGAARHYRSSLATVTRWRIEIGLSRHERAIKPSMIGPSPYRSKGFSERPLMQNRDLSVAGQAADYLRRFPSVYRCDENGKPNAKGQWWRRNFSVLSADQIIATARKLGWQELWG
jgi:hypothetical protein